ncbi:MAG: hypothetical protein HYZ54_11755 [Ignavibacteriae bacterium]|nr:hypothetical protein [Ignavibacteriota bacterium]
MQTFIALYLAPTSVITEWMKTDPAVREAADKKMREDWDTWMAAHGSMIKETKAGGQTKRVTKDGVTDTKNDIMLYSIIEAESHEAAAEAFVGHPHFGIPEASIEIMAIRSM